MALKGGFSIIYDIFKRFFDICLSSILILLFFPLSIIIMLFIAADSVGNVIFIQYRGGLYTKPFRMYKFRTMKKGTPANVATHALINPYHYITPVGRFLRRTSLDELPQLLNILKGDMSFVGPRPVVLTEMELLRERKRLGADKVRPGITGLAQIRGRDHVSCRQKALYDAFYVKNRSLKLDLWIIWQTVRCVLSGEGIHEGAPAMPVKTLRKRKSRRKIRHKI